MYVKFKVLVCAKYFCDITCIDTTFIDLNSCPSLS